MTGLEFEARGVVLQYESRAVRVLGPKDAGELMDEFRFAVLTRRSLVMGDAPKQVFRERYRCDLCGDQIGHGRTGECPLCPTRMCRGQSGGWCMLCVVAREKYVSALLEERKANPPSESEEAA